MQIEHLSATRVVYFRRTGAYGIENQQLMVAFKKWVQAENLFQTATLLGIALDHPQRTPVTACRYDACLVTNATIFNNQRVHQRTLAAGTYAVFQIRHTAAAINAFYQSLTQTIQKYQLSISNQPLIERYQSRLVATGNCEILVPIIEN